MAIAAVVEYAHLSVADVEALAVELEAIRLDIEDSRGGKDRAYIRRTITFQRCLDVAARLVIGGSRGKTGWALGAVALAAAKCIENMELATISATASGIAYTNLKSGVAMGLFPVLHAAVADLGIARGDQPSVLDRARKLVIDKVAARENIEAADVTATQIMNEVRRVRLETAPAGSPLRAELLEGFAAGGVGMQAAIGRATDTMKLRAGIAYLDFGLAALKAAGIERLFLFVDQLEDLANNRTLTKAKRDREVGRIRDLQEEDPYASQLRMVLTFHSTAAAALADMWLMHRLPSYEAVPANDAAVVVLRGITTEEDGAELLRVYLDAARVSDVDDDLMPFQADAVTELIAPSEGRIGILLSQAHRILDTAARAAAMTITSDFVADTLGGAPVRAPSPQPVISAGDEVDDILLA